MVAQLRGDAMRVAVLSAIAYGVFVSSTAISRIAQSGFDEQTTTIARLVTLFEIFFFAWFFRKNFPSVHRLVLFGCACEAVYIALYLLQVFGFDPISFISGISLPQLVGFTCGLAEGAFTLLFTYLFSIQVPRYSAVSIALGCLLLDVCTEFALLLPAELVPFFKICLLVTGTAAAIYSLKYASQSDAVLSVKQMAFAGYQKNASPESAGSQSLSKSHALSFLPSVIIFPFLYGIAIQLVNTAQTGLGTYSHAYSAVIILVLVTMLAYTLFKGATIQNTTLLLLIAPIITTAYILLAAFADQQLFWVGLFARLDYTIARLLFLIIMARIAHAFIEETCFYAAFFYGTLKLSALMGREVASVCIPMPLTQATCMIVALLALLLIILCCLSVLTARHIKKDEDDLDSSYGSAAQQPASLDGEPNNNPEPAPEQAANAGSSKAERFASHFGLSERETQIFEGFAKGYNMASIGNSLGLSTSTVGTYLHRIYIKTNVDNKQGLAEKYNEFE